MRRNILIMIGVAFAAPIFLAGVEAADPPTTGFEQPIFNPTLLPQRAWMEEAGFGTSAVVNTTSHGGAQSLEIDVQATVKRPLGVGNTVVYVDGWFRPELSPLLPTTGSPGIGPLFAFQTGIGLVGMNGDGAGSGQWIASGIIAPQVFMRFTVAMDLQSHRWHLYANESLALTELGFVDNAFSRLGGLRVSSEANNPNHLDDVTFSSVPPDFLAAPSDKVWVNASYTGLEFGTIVQPFDTVGEGAATVNPGGTLNIKSGNYPETPTLATAMVIKAINGPVVIGAP